MNFYPVHRGDEARAMGHLPPLRFGLITKLRSKYMDMATGGGIPAELAADWAGARTGAERAELRLVLTEFFELREGVYRRAEFDAVIEQYASKSKKARSSAAARWAQSERTVSGQRSHSDRNADAMRTHCDGNANPRIQESKRNTHAAHAAAVCVDSAIQAMRDAGLPDASAENPSLKALVKKGVPPEQFAGAARIAVGAGKGVAYALGVIKQQLRDAAATAKVPAQLQPAWDAGRTSIEAKGAELDSASGTRSHGPATAVRASRNTQAACAPRSPYVMRHRRVVHTPIILRRKPIMQCNEQRVPADPDEGELLRLIFRIAEAKLATMAPADAAKHAADLKRGNAVIALYVNAATTVIKFNPPAEVVESWFQ